MYCQDLQSSTQWLNNVRLTNIFVGLSVDIGVASGVLSLGGPTVASLTWGACGTRDPSGKVVHTYAAGHPPMSSIFITRPILRCGNGGFGYRHILKYHFTQWATIASYAGTDWRTLLDRQMQDSFHRPYTWCDDKDKNSVNYVGWLQIRNSRGRVVKTYYPRYAVGKTTKNLVTAFPQSRPVCKSKGGPW